jgi:hypothetical protein
MIIMMGNLYDIIEFVPTSPVELPEIPMKLMGVVNTDGLSMYSPEEWKDVTAVKKDWYYKAEILSRSFMLSGADNYVSNLSVDYDIHKIIFAGKERSAKCINLTKNAWDSDMFGDLLKINHSTDINPLFLKDLNIKNIRVFVFEVLSSTKKVG